MSARSCSPFPFHHGHHGTPHFGMAQQGGFDFAQLDAVAAYLDLKVLASQKFDGAVRARTAPGPRCDTSAAARFHKALRRHSGLPR